MLRVELLIVLLLLLGAAPAPAQTPAGEVAVSFHVTLAPTWFDPSTAPAQITPFGVLYAIHDALVRPLPGQKMGPSLAESWTESADGLVYEFRLRRGLKFHNGDPLTTDDVKWSFERYQGAGAREFRARVRQVEVVDPTVIRFHLKEPWPDFMTFYGTTATAAGIVLPRKYFEQVGADGFRQRPVGAGPYKFVSQRPGHRHHPRGLPRVLAARALRQAARHEERAGQHHALDHAEERGDRLRPLPRRPRGGGGDARPALPARGHAPRVDLLDRVRRTSGIPSRPGPTGGCGWPSTTRSTARRRTRRPVSATARPPGSSCRG